MPNGDSDLTKRGRGGSRVGSVVAWPVRALALVLSTTCNPHIWEVEAGRSDVQGPPLLHSVYEISLGYVRL